MLYPTSQVEISLPRRHMLRFRDGGGLMLRVLEGTLWITEERDTTDIVLEAGQSFVVKRRGQTLVSALKNARIAIVPRPASEELEPVTSPCLVAVAC
jgi:hypothetical protein